eukprot:5893343-Pleurochrysis_carterae.AAC.1
MRPPVAASAAVALDRAIRRPSPAAAASMSARAVVGMRPPLLPSAGPGHPARVRLPRGPRRHVCTAPLAAVP